MLKPAFPQDPLPFNPSLSLFYLAEDVLSAPRFSVPFGTGKSESGISVGVGQFPEGRT